MSQKCLSLKLLLQIVNFRDECSNKGGSKIGSCAEGFGVCCICKLAKNIAILSLSRVFFIVSSSCSGSTSENCTYFESPTGSNSVANGPCRMEVCKCNSNICQVSLQLL